MIIFYYYNHMSFYRDMSNRLETWNARLMSITYLIYKFMGFLRGNSCRDLPGLSPHILLVGLWQE